MQGTSSALRCIFKGEGWSSEVATKFFNKSEIVASTNNNITTEVHNF